MKKLSFIVALFLLSGCAQTHSVAELREQYEAGANRWGESPKRLFNKIFDRFGGTRNAVFGFEGPIASENVGVFQEFVNKMPRSAVIDADNAEFFFVVDERRERGEKIIRKQTYIQEVRVRIISRRAVARGSRVIAEVYANGVCQHTNAFIAHPPSCALAREKLISEALRGI